MQIYNKNSEHKNSDDKNNDDDDDEIISEETRKEMCFYMHHPPDRITHTTAFVTPVVEHWLEREMAQWVHHIDPTTHCTMSERSYHGATSRSIEVTRRRL